MGLKVANNFISAYSNSTNRQAQSVWKAFQSWLPHTVQKITIKELMEFLISCEQEKLLDPIHPAGHDIRKIGHSIALYRQVEPAEILKNGFWHSPNVFVHKYLISCKPVASHL